MLSDLNTPTKQRLRAHARRKNATLLKEAQKYRDGHGRARKQQADARRRAARLLQEAFRVEAGARAA